jgi:hypothetical protein
MKPNTRILSRGVAAALLVFCTGSCEKEPTTVEAETVEPVQLLFNGDVELGERLPDGWFAASAQLAQYVFTWADGNAARGRRSVGIRTSSTALSPSFAYWYQFVPVPPTTSPAAVTYVLTGSVKLEQVTGAGVAIAIRGDDRSSDERGAATTFATTQGSQILTGTRDWTRISVMLSAVPRNIDQFTVFLLHLTNSSGAVYFDDLMLSVEENTGVAP